MIYYLIFCLATSIVAIVMCQAPVVRKIHSREFGWVFWVSLFCMNFIIAPVLFLVIIFLPEIYKEYVLETLEEK